jgi:hypothetical protein
MKGLRLSDAYGAWVDLAEQSAGVALEMAGVTGAVTAAQIVASLIGIEDAQTRLLRSIKADTKLLREGPFRTGRLMLSEAGHVGSGSPRYTEFVRDACRYLYEAHELAASMEEKAVVELHLALAWFALGETSDAKRWLDKAADTSDKIVEDLLQATRSGPGQASLTVLDVRDPEAVAKFRSGGVSIGSAVKWTRLRRIGILTSAFFFIAAAPVVWLGYKGVDMVQAKKVEKLNEFLPFRNSVKAWALAVSGEPRQNPLALVPTTKKNAVALAWIKASPQRLPTASS